MKASDLIEGKEYAYDRTARQQRYRRFDPTDVTHVMVLKRRDEIEVPVNNWMSSRTKTVTRVLVKVMTTNTHYGGLGRKGSTHHVPALMLTRTWAEEQENRRLRVEQEEQWEREKRDAIKRQRRLRARLRRVGARPGYGPSNYEMQREDTPSASFVFDLDAMERLLNRAGVE